MAVGCLPLLFVSLSLPFKGKVVMLSVSWWYLGREDVMGRQPGLASLKQLNL